MRHEDVRRERYGRACAVAAIDAIAVDRDGRQPSRAALDGLLSRLGEMIRMTSRQADRVARVGSTRFHVLLPETGWDGARAFAERTARVAGSEVMLGTLGVRLRIAIGVPGSASRWKTPSP